MRKFINRLRTFFFTFMSKRKISSYKGILHVNRKSTFNNKTYLGSNTHFNGIKIAGCGEVHIGDNFHSGNGCLFLTENHNYQGEALPYDSSCICKNILIEDNVWLGERVIILGGITIGEGVIIQAGSVVVKDIPKYAIAGGHPAKVFSYRNIEHYQKLKYEGKFH